MGGIFYFLDICGNEKQDSYQNGYFNDRVMSKEDPSRKAPEILSSNKTIFKSFYIFSIAEKKDKIIKTNKQK